VAEFATVASGVLRYIGGDEFSDVYGQAASAGGGFGVSGTSANGTGVGGTSRSDSGVGISAANIAGGTALEVSSSSPAAAMPLC
jgi:hypothetical protein